MHSIIVMVAINFLEGEMKIMCIHRSALFKVTFAKEEKRAQLFGASTV